MASSQALALRRNTAQLAIADAMASLTGAAGIDYAPPPTSNDPLMAETLFLEWTAGVLVMVQDQTGATDLFGRYKERVDAQARADAEVDRRAAAAAGDPAADQDTAVRQLEERAQYLEREAAQQRKLAEELRKRAKQQAEGDEAPAPATKSPTLDAPPPWADGPNAAPADEGDAKTAKGKRANGGDAPQPKDAP